MNLCLFSVGDIFPQVSLNFMGGASMILDPEHYLMHYGFLVSMSIFSLVTLLPLLSFSNCIEMRVTNNRLMYATLISQDGAAMWCIGFQRTDQRFTILGG